MTSDYIEALLWSSQDEEDDLTGTQSAEFEAQCESDCETFTLRAEKILERLEEVESWDMAQMGHDFALTRNGHGVGFWDRPEIWGERGGALLTTLSHRFGEVWPYTGDDGQIYSE